LTPADILSIERGIVIAPAGCGKTHSIVEVLATHGDSLPILVLTHTNAGVAALRSRLNARGVAHQRYRLATIDGWAMRIVGMFPKRAEYTGGV